MNNYNYVMASANMEALLNTKLIAAGFDTYKIDRCEAIQDSPTGYWVHVIDQKPELTASIRRLAPTMPPEFNNVVYHNGNIPEAVVRWTSE